MGMKGKSPVEGANASEAGCSHKPPQGAECIEPGVFFRPADNRLWVSGYGFLGERGVEFARTLMASGLDNELILTAITVAAMKRFLDAFPQIGEEQARVTVCGHPKGGDA